MVPENDESGQNCRINASSEEEEKQSSSSEGKVQEAHLHILICGIFNSRCQHSDVQELDENKIKGINLNMKIVQPDCGVRFLLSQVPLQNCIERNYIKQMSNVLLRIIEL